MKRAIRVGTRESNLAIAQSKWVIDEIKKKFPHLEFELVGIKTTGDIVLDKSLDKIGGKGLFIKELETALINKTIDFAVHSMKDMPAILPDELHIAAISKREDPRDVLVTLDRKTLNELQAGAVVGTSSVRREVQLKHLREDLHVKTLRGNVLTRLDKLQKGEYDAILLAMAGLKRLGLEEKAVQLFEIDEMIPAVGQGALGIEARKGEDLDYLLESVNDEESSLAVIAERAFMEKLGGSCSTPIGAHAVIDGNKIKIYGMWALDGKGKIKRAVVEGDKSDAVALGQQLADIIVHGRKI
jgi:hydroxymethylbilane synthase